MDKAERAAGGYGGKGWSKGAREDGMRAFVNNGADAEDRLRQGSELREMGLVEVLTARAGDG